MIIAAADTTNPNAIAPNDLKWNPNPRSPLLCAGNMAIITDQKAAANGPSTPNAHLRSHISSCEAYFTARIGTIKKIAGAKSRNTRHSRECQRKRKGAVRKCTSPASWFRVASVRLSKIISYSKSWGRLRAGRPADAAGILLRLGCDLRRCGVVAKFLQPRFVLRGQPGGCVDSSRSF